MTSLNRRKIRPGNRSVEHSSKDVDAIGDLLIVGVGNRPDE